MFRCRDQFSIEVGLQYTTVFLECFHVLDLKTQARDGRGLHETASLKFDLRKGQEMAAPPSP